MMKLQSDNKCSDPPGAFAYAMFGLQFLSSIAGLCALYTGWANLW